MDGFIILHEVGTCRLTVPSGPGLSAGSAGTAPGSEMSKDLCVGSLEPFALQELHISVPGDKQMQAKSL